MFYCLYIYLDKRFSKYFERQFSIANQKTKTYCPWCIWWFVRRVGRWARGTVHFKFVWTAPKIWSFQNWSSVKEKSGKTILEGRMVEKSSGRIVCASRKGLENKNVVQTQPNATQKHLQDVSNRHSTRKFYTFDPQKSVKCFDAYFDTSTSSPSSIGWQQFE